MISVTRKLQRVAELCTELEDLLTSIKEEQELIRAHLAGPPKGSSELVLDTKERSATIAGATAYLGPSEFEILTILCKTEVPVSNGELLNALRPDGARPAEGAMGVHLSRLRKKLQSINGGVDVVRTYHRQGVKLRDEIVVRVLVS
jgi:DNA-binding response OmpR family regulator